MADYWPLVSKCERRLSSVSSFLNEAGRLQITNAVLTALPTYAMCTFLLPKTVIKQIDKFRKHCLWRGSDMNSKKPAKAAWPLVCLPKDSGGLGALNLYIQNVSLLLKQLHKFYNNLDIPWVQLIWNCYYQNGELPHHNNKGSFWWKDVLKSITSYKGMASVTILDGYTSFFWSDIWNGRLFSSQFPELFSFAKDKHISVQSFISMLAIEEPDELFHLPLSTQAYGQFQ